MNLWKFSKYVDQLAFAVLNVGTIAFVTKFLSADSAAKYIIINTYSSFSLVVVVALVITPFWVFSVENIEREFNFGLMLNIFISIISGVLLSLLYSLKESGTISDVIQISIIALTYPLYDYLRRTLYVLNKESIAAIITTTLTVTVALTYALLKFTGYDDYHYYIYALGAELFVAAAVIYVYILKVQRVFFSFIPRAMLSNINKYFRYGKWSALSMSCFWLSTQGLFLIFYGKITNEEIVVTRLCLSITGIMSIYFAALENDLMPKLRRAVINRDVGYILKERNAYFKNGIAICTLSSLLILVVFNFIYGNKDNALTIYVILSLYQIITGVFKYYAYVLKSSQRHNVTFIANLIGLLSSVLSMIVLYNHYNISLSIIMLINGIFCSAGYVFFIRKYKVM